MNGAMRIATLAWVLVPLIGSSRGESIGVGIVCRPLDEWTLMKSEHMEVWYAKVIASGGWRYGLPGAQSRQQWGKGVSCTGGR